MESRRKQFFGGLIFIVGFALLLMGFRAAAFLPGFAGEFFRTALGFVSTPLIMEGTFALFGLALLVFVNHLRDKRDGDEFVYLEEVTDPAAPEKLPNHARFGIYQGQPLPPPTDAFLAAAEGAFELEDYGTALEILAVMEPAERDAPDALALRLRLARATGCTETAAKLSARLAATAPGHPALDFSAE